MLKCLEGKPYEDWLRSPGLSLEKRIMREDLTTVTTTSPEG